MEPDSGLAATRIAEVSINELYGDFRTASQPVGTMQMHFIIYEVNDHAAGRVVLDRVCAHETRLPEKHPTPSWPHGMWICVLSWMR